ncbi:inorganic diphosphatase [Candidatus Poriferisodalis sp.]|uniref:inorganic diphosphatase n=1 Tax=Candidatus Poriferisodalis sp. TaxID=3101277 RepID=UPI003B0189C3
MTESASVIDAMQRTHMRSQMFVENPAGSITKHLYDEDTLVLVGKQHVAVPYPYTYGFIPRVAAPDGGCLDCFLFDTAPTTTGDILEVEIVGLLEQFEELGDQRLIEDHNLLTRRVNDNRPATDDEIETLREFITSVFGDTGPLMHVGAVRDARHAAQLLFDRQSRGAVN